MSQSKTQSVHAGSASYESLILSMAPLHYWRLIEATGTVAKDLGSGAANGTYTNTPTLNSGGAITRDSGKGASFAKASSEYVDVGTLGNLGGSLGNGFSCSFWVKTTDATRWLAFGTVNSTGNDTLLRVFLNQEDTAGETEGYIAAMLRDEDDTELRGDTGADTGITDGAWHHIMVTMDGAADTLVFYVDSVAVGPVYRFQNTPDNFANFDRNMYLAALNNGAVSFPAEAVFQEMAFWNSVLTQADADKLYLVGKNGA